MAKIGRNEPCPCKNGKKYKHCHGGINAPQNNSNIIPDGQKLLLMLERQKAKQKAAEKQQGLGKPIISASLENSRFVAVGGNLFHSRNCKTFHDFLMQYIKKTLGEDWGNEELAKPFEERHVILQWYKLMGDYMKNPIRKQGEVNWSPMIGVVDAYLNLAYNLYIIAHNKELQERLVRRLKRADQFPGAYNETFVFAYLMKAGFDVEFEDESGATPGKKTECIATHRISKKQYSVEAKSINRVGVLGTKINGTNKRLKASIRDQLNSAFKKPSIHPRIIFVEANIPCIKPNGKEPDWFDDARVAVQEREKTLEQGKSAYVICMNHPAHHPSNLQHCDYARSIIPLGCAIKDFGNKAEFPSLRDYYYAKKSHQDIYDLIESADKHYQIPSTFDGEIPELAFTDKMQNRLLIGKRYLLPDQNGNNVISTLEEALVAEKEREVIGIYRVEGNEQRIIGRCPISDLEYQAYKRDPDTFFGVVKEVPKSLKDDDYVGLFEFFVKGCLPIPKEKLLEAMQNSEDIEYLKTLGQEELAVTHSERLTLAAKQEFRKKNTTI